MPIRFKLLLTSITAIILTLALGAMLYTTSSQLSDAQIKTRTIDAIQKSIVELHSLTYDYLLHPQQRAEEQWILKHEAITKLLVLPKFTMQREQVILEKLHSDNEAIKGLFLEFKQSSPSSELKQRLTAQLSIKIQEVSTEAFTLAGISDSQANALTQRANIVVLVFTTLIIILMIGLILLTNFTIVRPILKLTQSTQNITKGGELDFAIDPDLTSSNDEIGQLGRAFKDLVSKLAASNQNLEKKVEEKTGQLSTQLVELEKVNKLMVGRELKMIELKKEIENLKKQ